MSQLAILDIESTGLEDDDEPISIAVLLVRTNDTALGEVVASWYGEQQPSKEISYEAHRVNGFSEEMLRGKQFDLCSLRAILDNADILASHNARFDARMLNKVLPGFLSKSWRCTANQVSNLPGFENNSLDAVCSYFKIEREFPHNSLSDCKALWSALNRHTGKTSRSKTYLRHLLDADRWMVFPKRDLFLTLDSPEGIIFKSIEQRELLACSVGTLIRLWTTDQLDVVIGYAMLRGYCGGQGEVFRFKKKDNPQFSRFDIQTTYFEVVSYSENGLVVSRSHT